MRIVGGKFRGRKLQPTNLKFTRPTTDFAREGLLNMLNSRLEWEGLDVLDLYSGTGAMALEFLSRGAESAIAVDSQVASVKFIHSIKLKWEVTNLEIVKTDAKRFIQGCHSKFGLIFADPPYDSKDYEELIQLVYEKELLLPNGLFVVEHQKGINFSDKEGFEAHRSFGNVNFSIFSSLKTN